MLEKYRTQIEQVLGVSLTSGSTLEWNCENVAEAKIVKKRLVLMQRELRAIKASVNQEMKSIRTEYNNRISGVSSGLDKGAMSLVFGRKTGGRYSTLKKQGLRNERDRVLAPYQSTKDRIDRLILSIDQEKLNLDRWIAEQAAE